MGATKTVQSNKIPSTNNSSKGEEVEVLYQKLGDRWFAFSLINDEVFVGSITQEEIDAAEAQKALAARRQKGNA